MKLRLLIDTCVWLDLTKDPRHLPLLDALFAMIEANEVQLIVPQIILDEFARNRDRVMGDYPQIPLARLAPLWSPSQNGEMRPCVAR